MSSCKDSLIKYILLHKSTLDELALTEMPSASLQRLDVMKPKADISIYKPQGFVKTGPSIATENNNNEKFGAQNSQ
jgi:hypothetical protein